MRQLSLAFAMLLAACAGSCTPGGVPVTSAPAHGTRVDTNAGILLLDTNNRVQATRHTVAGTPEALWPALVRTYVDLGISVAHLDSTRHVIGNPDLPARREFAGQRITNLLDCGRTAVGVPIADRYAVTVQVFTQLVRSEGGTEVRSVLTGRAVNPTTNDPPVQCASTGRLEGRIAAGIALQGT